MKNIFLFIILLCSIHVTYSQKELTNENVESEIEKLANDLNLLINEVNLYNCENQNIVKKQLASIKKILEEKSMAIEDLKEKKTQVFNSYDNFLYSAKETLLAYDKEAKLVNKLCKTLETSEAIISENDIKNIIELSDGYEFIADAFESYESQIKSFHESLLDAKKNGFLLKPRCRSIEQVLEFVNKVDENYPEMLKMVIDLNERFYNLPKNQQDILISGNTDPLFGKYNSIIKSDPNTTYRNVLSTDSIRKLIANINSILNCNNEHTVEKSYFENGNIKTVGAKRNGLKTGEWKEYYENGNLYKEVVFIEGEMVGQGEVYFENGQTKLIGLYINSQMNGEWAQFYENGQLAGNGNYKNGEKTGEWIEYYENSQFMEIGIYENGIKKGEWKSYNENGQLSFIGRLENGELNGKSTYYYENGQFKAIGMYLNGKMNGEFKFYRENGQLSAIGSLVNDKETGEWKTYYKNEQLSAIGKYENGKKTGEWKLYWGNGKLESYGDYANGEKTGQWIHLNENGKYLYDIRF
jgi:antitoxin component YwqK of YwqJK toxin-antitoxin module